MRLHPLEGHLESLFEGEAFDILSKEEIESDADLSLIISERIKHLAEALSLDYQRLLSWIYLRVMISAQWFVEDNGDATDMLKLAKVIYPLVPR